MEDTAEILTRFFPREILNFDVPPPGAQIGPLHAIFQKVGLALGQFTNDVLTLKAMVAVQSAAGPHLDHHGVLYGVQRLPEEVGNDEPYRTRILEALSTGKLTIAAIAAAVQNYYNSTRANPPTVTVWDLRSNPTLAAQYGIVRLQFVIDIQFTVDASQVFFAGRSYAGRNTYLYDPSIVSFGSTPSDTRLAGVVIRTKAGGTEPVYRLRRYLRAAR